MRQIQGLAASRGIALGPAWRLDPPLSTCPRRNVEDPASEWERAQAALEVARRQLAELVTRARELAGEEHAAIFQAQALMLEDPALLEAARAAIEIGRLNAEAALVDAAEAQAQQLEALEDEYLRARAADVRDVAQRLLRILTGCTEPNLACGAAPVVLVATDLSPSELITLDRRKILGVCTAEGGPTSHTAILARGLGLPAVVGAGPAVLQIPDATPVVLDGSAGLLIVEPDAETLAAYRERRAMAARLAAQAGVRAHAPAITRDGQRVPVLANVGDLASAQAALEAGADGAGLVRTEFLYLGRSSLPSEEEQFSAYRALADLFGVLPVVLRTLDIGADKRLAGLDQPLEPNPALGAARHPALAGATSAAENAVAGGAAGVGRALAAGDVPAGCDDRRSARGSGHSRGLPHGAGGWRA
jgi:phosphoenolpyruvate-protein kinase (PTS system EI component)